MNTCEWRKTHIFPENYLVSENGEVYSVSSDKILRPNTDKYGYKYYTLCVNGARKSVKEHRLVALAFIENPENKPAIDHINGIKTDNRACNLQWVTNKENTHNPVTMPKLIKESMKRIPSMCNESAKRNFGRKPVKIVYKDGNTVVYPSLKVASQEIGKNYSKLSEVINGKRKQYKEFAALWASEIEEFPMAVTRRHFGEDEWHDIEIFEKWAQEEEGL